MEENNAIEKKEEIDLNAKEIIKKANNSIKLSEAQIKELINKINIDFDFDKILEQLKSKYPLSSDKYVIFTNGKEQLFYENGEFFVISATDSTKQKKKLKRKEALDLYSEYHIINILNPLLEQKKLNNKKIVNVIKSDEIKEEKITKKIEEEKEEEVKKQESKSKQEIEQIKTQVKDVKQMQDVKDRFEKLKEKEEEIKQKRKKQNKVR